MIEWIEPKTDWEKTDKFNIDDFNRIRNNVQWLHQKLSEINMFFDIADMGDAETTHARYPTAAVFNAIEQNVQYINSRMENKDFGVTKTFFPNGAFITYDELNRIESMELDMKTSIDSIEKNIRHIPFRLGGYDAIRI